MIGTTVSHYRITGRLGQGGMGDVYVGFDETLARKVALKAIRPDRRLSPDARARFLREARVLSQLDHPRICRVFDYVTGDAADFIVLELVLGRSLRDALSERLSRQQALSIAEQIVEVMVVAHAAGIVHRDLKPENVMLDEAGGVKVLDFGLARLMGAPRERPSAPSDAVDLEDADTLGPADPGRPVDGAGPPEDGTVDQPTDSSGPLTALGSITGTLRYMSPEQARGEPATTASDMYSMGIVIQELFTGERAYPPEVVGDELLRLVARGKTRPAQGLPPETLRLVQGLESLAPSQRPTALEAASRLRRIRERPQRRVRQAAVAGALGLVALAGIKYTVDLRHERGVADTARQDADRRRTQAEGLISFMLGDLRTKLEPVGRLDVLDEVGEKAREYFAAVPESQMTDSELFRRSQALRQIGEVRVAQGRLDKALSTFQESLILAEDLERRDPLRKEWQVGLGASHFWVGYIAFYQGRTKEAEAPFLRYLDIARRLVEREPKSREFRTELGYAQSNLGSLREKQGDLESALASFREALSVTESLLGETPDDAALQSDVAVAHNKVAVILAKLGDLEDALGHYQADVEIKARLVAREPSNTRWLDALSIGRVYLAGALRDRGDAGLERSQLDEALRIRRNLVGHDPANADWAWQLAVVTMNLGRAALHRGDVAGAASLTRQSREALALLVGKDKSNTDWQQDYAFALHNEAVVSLAAGRLQEARRQALAAVEAFERLVASDASEARSRRGLAQTLLELGRALEATHDRPGAARAWGRALQELEGLRPPGVEVQGVKARVLFRLGRASEARPIALDLVAKGYRFPELVQLCREMKLGLPAGGTAR
jgi:eukaryotic-like serine/threonine-protein kinase